MSKYNERPVHVTLPKKGANLRELQEFITNWESQRTFFDRSCGYVSWAQGRALNAAREVCPRGKWSAFLQTIKMSRATAYHLMRIARDVPEENAQGMTYKQMLANVYPSFSKELKNDDPGEVPAPSTNGKRQSKSASTVTIIGCVDALVSIKLRLQKLGDSKIIETGFVLDQHREKVGQALATAKTASAEFDKIILRLDAKFSELSKRIAGETVSKAA